MLFRFMILVAVFAITPSVWADSLRCSDGKIEIWIGEQVPSPGDQMLGHFKLVKPRADGGADTLFAVDAEPVQVAGKTRRVNLLTGELRALHVNVDDAITAMDAAKKLEASKVVVDGRKLTDIQSLNFSIAGKIDFDDETKTYDGELITTEFRQTGTGKYLVGTQIYECKFKKEDPK